VSSLSAIGADPPMTETAASALAPAP